MLFFFELYYMFHDATKITRIWQACEMELEKQVFWQKTIAKTLWLLAGVFENPN